jgi:magnesium transporter
MYSYAEELIEDVNSLLSIQLALAQHRTSEVVRVLTVFSVFFLPLTFIVGIYGMNFAPEPPEHRPLTMNMPELYHPYGYIGVLALMLLIAVIQLVIFKKKKWL